MPLKSESNPAGLREKRRVRKEALPPAAWLGIPATGKKLQIRMFTVHRVVQGKIVEDGILVESLGIFEQLGVVSNTAELVGNFLRQKIAVEKHSVAPKAVSMSDAGC